MFIGESPAMFLVYACGVLPAVVIFNFILRRVLARMEKKARQTDVTWDAALISAACRPASWLTWVIGFSLAARIVELQIVEQEMRATLLNVVSIVCTIGVIACLAWFLVRFIGNMQCVFIQRKTERGDDPDRTIIDATGQILKIVIIVIASLMALQSQGVSVSGVLAFGGIGGIAIGFAARDLLANFFGGLMIYLDRPFAVGDWVRSSEKQIEGTVEEIGWRITRIRTFDKRPLYVPNSVFTSITVENPSRTSNRRINETIGVRYEDIGKVPGVVEDIRAMLLAHPEIDQSQTLVVTFTRFGEFSLDIMVNTFTRTTDGQRFHEVKQDVLLKIADIIEQRGAQIAYPTRVSYNSPIPWELTAAGDDNNREGVKQ